MTRSRDIADQQKNLGGAVAPISGGKNAIINGGFDFWQRGTSLSSSSGSLTNTFLADRWAFNYYSANSNNATISQQPLTPGDISGYNGQYLMRSVFPIQAAGSYWETTHKIEDVRTFAGQTVTLSYYARITSGTAMGMNWEIEQNFGTGGSASVYQYTGFGALTSQWQRIVINFNLGSITGKTIGANSFLKFKYYSGPSAGATTAFTLETTGVQLELGSTATPFSRAGGSIGGELALCQRYYQRISSTGGYTALSNYGIAGSTTTTSTPLPLKSSMRTVPNAIDYANVRVTDTVGVASNITNNLTIESATTETIVINASSLSGFTQYRPVIIQTQASGNGYIGFSAEL